MGWWREIRRALGDRHFWVLFGWSLLVLCAFIYLFWLAIRAAGRFSFVTPVLCGANESEIRIMAMLLLGPFFAISTLSAIGELWNTIDSRRRGRRVRFIGFFGYAGLAFLLGNAILLALSC